MTPMTDRALIRPASVPAAPGVYLFKDRAGRVIYVGKAKSLRSRTASYFGPDLHPRTAAMLDAAAELEWIVTENEVEALHLELNLIKEHRPRYNVRYRDDKSYPYLAVTLDEEIPRARVMRGPKRKGVRYYGPYAHAYAIRDTLDLLLRTFPVRTCSQGVFDRCRRRGRPCLLYHIERCSGPCIGAVTAEQHRAIVERLCDFLDGDTKPVLAELEAAMRAAAARQQYEIAAKYRDQLDNVRKAVERQQMVISERADIDVVAMVADELEAAFQVFFVRKGRVTGRKGSIVDRVEDLDEPGLIGRFLEHHYADADDLPRTVLVPQEPADRVLIEAWLGARRGAKVEVKVPRRGERRALLETVTENARQAFAQHRLKRSSDFAARARQLRELQEALGMEQAPLRIECFDISNLGPIEAVGSMVVFEDGLPKRSDYRRFRIRYTSGPDDFAMIGEVIRRRFSRYLAERADDAGPGKRFAYPPQLVVVDGGKGQLGRAVEVLDDLGISDVTVIALAKRMEEVYLPGRPEPLRIGRGSEALYLLQHLRDEAHRFALELHRKRRTKAMTASILDSIPGVGEARRKRLLKRFGSVKRIRAASVDDIASVPGIPRPVAEAVHKALNEGRRAS